MSGDVGCKAVAEQESRLNYSTQEVYWDITGKGQETVLRNPDIKISEKKDEETGKCQIWTTAQVVWDGFLQVSA